MKIWIRVLVGLALVMLVASSLPAQQISATLTGIVSDPSNAVVPQAQIKLRNESSGSERVTITNNEGYFTFASLDVGDYTYELTVTAKGFLTYKAPGIALSGGEKRNVNVTLKVGSTTEVVEVTGVADTLVPQDSGEKSAMLTKKELDNFVEVGSNAAEFIKMMPGFNIQNGTKNSANYTGETIGINANGDAGSMSPLNNAYSYNGLPSNSLDITADGAHVSDPGCNCDTPVNPNADMVSELKVVTSNFSAENQKGPAVLSSVAKSGGKDFHGEAYFSARNYVMNANDSQFNDEGASRPENKYYYPGGNVGGPVFIPGHFNKNREKLFFFTGYEYFYQVLDTGILHATVPLPDMLTGNFSPAEMAKLGTITAAGVAPGELNAAAQAKYGGYQIPAAQIDPNMVALAKLYPAANADPNSTGGYNYVQSEIFNENNIQWMSRVDYNISDNTKLYFRYNMQRETQQFPVGLWWRQGDQVPYPTPVLGKNKSDSYTASLTHVFSPSMTNEFVFGYTYVGFPNVFSDPSKVDRTKVGYTYTGLFNNGIKQIPSFGGNGGNTEAALIFNPSGFEAGGATQGLYADKWMPSLSDTVTKVFGTHTLKAGFYWEWIRNAQPDNPNGNGYAQFISPGNINTTGDSYADMMIGMFSNYNEQNFTAMHDIAYNTYEGFVQDSWKVNKRLTLDLGLRISHFQPWYDRTGYGFSIFNPAQYDPTAPASAYSGFEWNKRDPSVPSAGFPTRGAFYAPRFGLAYDVFGKGNTVIRGGWGRFYYHSGQFTAGLNAAQGNASTSINQSTENGTPIYMSDLTSVPLSLAAAGAAAVNSKDDKEPYTDSYSFTIAQRLPWSTLMEVAYVGNTSNDLLNQGNVGTNLNLIPVGALLASANGGVDPNKLNQNPFRPILGFGDLPIIGNNLSSNYNSLQVTWLRSKGRYNINANYTYGKSLGNTSAGGDQFNVNDNYGILGFDRRQAFNLAYSIELGNPVHGNKVAGGVVNGWQVSGLVQMASGADLTGGGSIGYNLNSAVIPGSITGPTGLTPNGIQISNLSILGTPDISLQPYLTCNPTSGLGPHQYINGSCFAAPTTIGANGPNVIPAIYGPAFFNWDMGLFKNFQIGEKKKVQIRVNGYNFLNHPLWSFPGGSNLTLNYTQASGGGAITEQPNSNFGIATEKNGHRIIMLTVKFYF
jgi:hypothetical protein